MHKRAFTLIELLVVIAIIAILSALTIPAITALNGAGNLTGATYEIKGILDQARTYAMANNTYVWVGFFEEAATTPQTAGVGQVVMSVVASRDGTSIYSLPLSAGSVTTLTPASLVQINKLTKIPNLHLNNFTFGSGTGSTFDTRPAVTSSAQIGNLTGSSPAAPATTFQYPVGSATAQYTFTQAIQFDPRGDAVINNSGSTLVPYIEIGLQPTHGTVINTSSPNDAAIQVSGINGNVQIYRR